MLYIATPHGDTISGSLTHTAAHNPAQARMLQREARVAFTSLLLTEIPGHEG